MFYICYTVTLQPDPRVPFERGSGVEYRAAGRRVVGGLESQRDGWLTHMLIYALAINPDRAMAETNLYLRPAHLLRVTWLWNFDVYFLFKIFIANWQELKISKELEEEKKKANIFYHLTKRIKQWRMKNVL